MESSQTMYIYTCRLWGYASTLTVAKSIANMPGTYIVSVSVLELSRFYKLSYKYYMIGVV